MIDPEVTISCYGDCDSETGDAWSAFTADGYGVGVELAPDAIAAYVREHGCPDCGSLTARLVHYTEFSDDEALTVVRSWQSPEYFDE